MKQEPSDQNSVDEDSMERAVVEFLKAHPEFLQQHPDVFASLEVVHKPTGSSVSLIERQVSVLRQRERQSELQIKEMISAARRNETLSRRLHQFAVTLIQAVDYSRQLSTHINKIVEGEELASITVVVGGDLTRSPKETRLQQNKIAEYRELRNRISHGASVCDDRLPRRLLDYLFGADSTVQSTALIPLVTSGQRPFGIVALGATESDRFNPSMGTHYLDRLGQLLAAALRRYEQD